MNSALAQDFATCRLGTDGHRFAYRDCAGAWGSVRVRVNRAGIAHRQTDARALPGPVPRRLLPGAIRAIEAITT